MDALVLSYRGEPLREFVLHSALEVGSAPSCDVVIHDSRVPSRKWLLVPKDGRVEAYDLVQGRPTRAHSTPVLLGQKLPVGDDYSLTRVRDATAQIRRRTPWTDELAAIDHDDETFALVVGGGPEARRVRLSATPLYVGSRDSSELVLDDRTVSGRHCRFAVVRDGVEVRDLGSKNGTWVDGARIVVAKVAAGTRIRAGKTDLFVVGSGARGASAPAIVAASPLMVATLAEVERYASVAWPVLVHGESGTGKELVARALHERGRRAKGPFVALNSGGIPRELVESELFGHEKGAFTGAQASRRGAFEVAHGGTLFLDEIGELPLDVQAHLLRVLETGEVRRVGAETTVKVDVRIVCATHRDLRHEIEAGTFRQDLYYRLARLVVRVPPLRDRPEDIDALADRFLEAASSELGRRALTPEARQRLHRHRWPGNVRELRNVICAASARSASGCVERADVEHAISELSPSHLDHFTPDRLRRAVERAQGNVTAAAKALGVPRSTLRYRIKELAFADPPDGRRRRSVSE
jgi:DNA-binding NtrC family response regulator